MSAAGLPTHAPVLASAPHNRALLASATAATSRETLADMKKGTKLDEEPAADSAADGGDAAADAPAAIATLASVADRSRLERHPSAGKRRRTDSEGPAMPLETAPSDAVTEAESVSWIVMCAASK